MTRTFLLTLDLPDNEDIQSVVDDITDELLDYFDVLSVKPWSPHDDFLPSTPPSEGSESLGQ